MPEIAILDVGHGNCGILIDTGAVTVIDAPLGDTHLVELRNRGITRVDSILVSHADADHCGGVLTLLLATDIVVGEVFLNPDALKRSDAWDELMVALRDAEARCGTVLKTSLTSTTPGVCVGHTELKVEVLAPHPTLVAKGPGSTHKGRPVTSNSASAVVRVSYAGRPVVLFSGDVDSVALNDISELGPDCRAKYLIFPHHGGLPGGGDAAQFTGDLCRLVGPEVVIFSIGRGRSGTPRAEIVEALRIAVRGVHVACTQLSSACARSLPSAPSTHLAACHSRGSRENSTCAGSILIRLEPGREELSPLLADHARFIDGNAPDALCRRALPATPDL